MDKENEKQEVEKKLEVVKVIVVMVDEYLMYYVLILMILRII